MARTLSSVPSVKRGTLTSHNGNSEQMDRAKDALPLRMKVTPRIFTRWKQTGHACSMPFVNAAF
jgi:hypothetical protein